MPAPRSAPEGEVIRAGRLLRGLTQHQLAALVPRVTRGLVAQWESANVAVPLKHRVRLVTAARPTGDEIGLHCARLRLPQAELARHVGVGRSTVHNWTRGQTIAEQWWVPLARVLLEVESSPDPDQLLNDGVLDLLEERHGGLTRTAIRKAFPCTPEVVYGAVDRLVERGAIAERTVLFVDKRGWHRVRSELFATRRIPDPLPEEHVAEGEDLRALRKRLGLTVSQLARLCQVHDDQVTNWERGQVPAARRASLAAALALAQQKTPGDWKDARLDAAVEALVAHLRERPAAEPREVVSILPGVRREERSDVLRLARERKLVREEIVGCRIRLHAADAAEVEDRSAHVDRDELLRRRHDAGLTVVELAEEVGVSPSQIGFWETGRQEIPVVRAAALDDALTRAESIAHERARTYQLQATIDRANKAPVLGGDILRSARKARGWTQAELAQRLGVSCSTVADWEYERRKIRDRHEPPIRAAFSSS